jgi:D-alanyl-D-alanine carboxypeptidase (penicillin-binding protein 5/6)
LDFGFANFKSIQLAKKNEIVATLPIEKGNLQEIEIITAEMVGLLAGKEEKGDYATEMIHPKRLNAPLRKGDRVGSMQIISGNKILKEVDLIVSKDVEKASFGLLFKRYLGLWIRFGR